MRATLLLFVIAAVGQCQSGPQGMASLTGKVLDPTGAAYSGAAIQAKNAKGGQVFKATSMAGGKYTFPDLPPGDYDISANVAGLRGYDKKGVAVSAKLVEFDIRLEEGTQLSTLGEDGLAALANLKRHA